jgi:GTP-binding protein Era
VPEVFNVLFIAGVTGVLPKRSIDRQTERFFVRRFEKNLIEQEKEIPYAAEIVTEEFFEDEKIIRIRS